MPAPFVFKLREGTGQVEKAEASRGERDRAGKRTVILAYLAKPQWKCRSPTVEEAEKKSGSEMGSR